jgi:hemoglobin
MGESHAGRGITTAQFNALVEDLISVMAARKVPFSAQNRLLKRLAPMHREIVAP